MMIPTMSEYPTPDGCEEQWFALRVRPRFEKVVATAVRNKGFEEFLPLCRRQRRWSDRHKLVDLPLFPGYIFCRLNPRHRLPLLVTPGVLYMVGVGKIPSPIDFREIEAIQCLVRSGLVAEPWPFLEIGQSVCVESGPLSGVEGVLMEVRKQHRIVLSVTLLQRSVAVEIEREWVRPIPATAGLFPQTPALDAMATASLS